MLWIRKNLFSSYLSGIATVLFGWIAFEIASTFLDWAVLRAVWPGSGIENCNGGANANPGACWVLIYDNISWLLVAFYPEEETWRVFVTYGALLASMSWLASRVLPGRRWAVLLVFMVLPILSHLFLDHGLGPDRSMYAFGGLLGALYFAYLAFVVALIFGLVLALGYLSNLPVLRLMAAGFVTVMTNIPVLPLVMLMSTGINYFLPAGMLWELISRIITLFGLLFSAYVCRCLTSAIQAIPQEEITLGKSLGLGPWAVLYRIVLPQALQAAIPSLMNIGVGLVKATTVLIMIGYFDLLGISRAISSHYMNQPDVSFYPHLTNYAFAAIIYFAVCFGLSLYGRRLYRVTQVPRPKNSKNAVTLELRGYDGSSLS